MHTVSYEINNGIKHRFVAIWRRFINCILIDISPLNSFQKNPLLLRIFQNSSGFYGPIG